MIKALKYTFSYVLKYGDRGLLKYGLIDCRNLNFALYLQSQELQEISNQFKKISNNVGNFEQYENLTHKLIKHLNSQNIADFSKIIHQYNILDLDIWKTLINTLVADAEQLEITQILITLKNVQKFVQTKFRKEEPKNFKYYYLEQELTTILNPRQLISIIKQIKFDENTKQEYIITVGILLQLFNKLSRVQSIQFYEIYQILTDRLQNTVESNLQSLNQQHLMILYQIFGIHKKISEELAKSFKSSYNEKNLAQILEIWKQHGQYDLELFDIVKPQILDFMSKCYDQQSKQKVISQLIFANVQDKEILGLIEQEFSMPFNKNSRMSYNQIQVYLICQRLLKLRHPYLKFQEQKIELPNINNKQSKSQQELILLQYLQLYAQILSEEVKIKVDEKCFQYLIDIALYFKDQKIAFELSGSVYFKKELLTGKKQAKKEILISEGWNPIFFSNTEQILFNNFSFSNQNLPDKVEQLFDQIFERALGRKLIKK